MANLLVKGKKPDNDGLALSVTPESAGWWISTRALGSASRLPGEPAASSTAAADAA